ncbi:MAG: phosphoribosyltransferase [Acidobacteriia bacterium]|nr:phosphoribosyltransferase [Terriglobia bacterium]
MILAFRNQVTAVTDQSSENAEDTKGDVMGNHTNNETNGFVFQDRSEAGYLLANRLKAYTNLRDVEVLALPRGGVPIGAEIARALNAPLFPFIVRKLGVPGHKELAMGAITNSGRPLVNRTVTRKLGLSDRFVDTVIRRETKRLLRAQNLYCAGRPMPLLEGKIVILADDGASTGSSLSLAVQAVQELGAAYVIVALPVAPPYAVSQLNKIANEVLCLMQPRKLVTVSRWYHEFPMPTDREICQMLDGAGIQMPRKSA